MSSDKAKKKKTEYSLKYAKENLKRIPLDVRIEDYEKILKASKKTGESVNGYIKKAINQRIEKEK